MATAKFSGGEPGRSQATILVVEDEPILRMVLVSALDDAGFQVAEAAQSDEAESLLADTPRVDLMITEVQMGGDRDGWALASLVRSRYPETKIVVTSGRPSSDIDSVADAFFAKPYDLDDVVQRISHMVDSRAEV